MPGLSVAGAVCAGGQLSFLPEWQLISGAALLASVAIITFLYLVNKFFQNAEGTGWAKIELYEVFVTVLIIIGVIAASDLACNINASWLFPGSTIPSGYNIYDGAIFYLDSFSSGVMHITTALYGFYSGLDLISSMKLTGKPLGLGAQLQPTGGFAATIKPGLTNAFNVLIIAFILNKAQIFLILFVALGFLKYYLPIGLFLRSFTPTRRIGGTIIAISLGFLFVYPFLIIMEGEIGLQPIKASDNLITNFSSEVSGVGGQEMMDWWKDSMGVLGIFDFIGKLMRSGIEVLAFGILYLAGNAAGYAFLIGLFFPAFNTLILVTTIRYLSKSMGEEIDVTNLTRLI